MSERRHSEDDTGNLGRGSEPIKGMIEKIEHKEKDFLQEQWNERYRRLERIKERKFGYKQKVGKSQPIKELAEDVEWRKDLDCLTQDAYDFIRRTADRDKKVTLEDFVTYWNNTPYIFYGKAELKNKDDKHWAEIQGIKFFENQIEI